MLVFSPIVYVLVLLVGDNTNNGEVADAGLKKHQSGFKNLTGVTNLFNLPQHYKCSGAGNTSRDENHYILADFLRLQGSHNNCIFL